MLLHAIPVLDPIIEVSSESSSINSSTITSVDDEVPAANRTLDSTRSYRSELTVTNPHDPEEGDELSGVGDVRACNQSCEEQEGTTHKRVGKTDRSVKRVKTFNNTTTPPKLQKKRSRRFSLGPLSQAVDPADVDDNASIDTVTEGDADWLDIDDIWWMSKVGMGPSSPIPSPSSPTSPTSPTSNSHPAPEQPKSLWAWSPLHHESEEKTASALMDLYKAYEPQSSPNISHTYTTTNPIPAITISPTEPYNDPSLHLRPPSSSDSSTIASTVRKGRHRRTPSPVFAALDPDLAAALEPPSNTFVLNFFSPDLDDYVGAYIVSGTTLIIRTGIGSVYFRSSAALITIQRVSSKKTFTPSVLLTAFRRRGAGVAPHQASDNNEKVDRKNTTTKVKPGPHSMENQVHLWGASTPKSRDVNTTTDVALSDELTPPLTPDQRTEFKILTPHRGTLKLVASSHEDFQRFRKAVERARVLALASLRAEEDDAMLDANPSAYANGTGSGSGGSNGTSVQGSDATRTRTGHAWGARLLWTIRERDPSNCYCFDCGAHWPEWFSLNRKTNIVVLVCDACAGTHRTHPSTTHTIRSFLFDESVFRDPCGETYRAVERASNAQARMQIELKMLKKKLAKTTKTTKTRKSGAKTTSRKKGGRERRERREGSLKVKKKRSLGVIGVAMPRRSRKWRKNRPASIHSHRSSDSSSSSDSYGDDDDDDDDESTLSSAASISCSESSSSSRTSFSDSDSVDSYIRDSPSDSDSESYDSSGISKPRRRNKQQHQHQQQHQKEVKEKEKEKERILVQFSRRLVFRSVSASVSRSKSLKSKSKSKANSNSKAKADSEVKGGLFLRRGFTVNSTSAATVKSGDDNADEKPTVAELLGAGLGSGLEVPPVATTAPSSVTDPNRLQVQVQVQDANPMREEEESNTSSLGRRLTFGKKRTAVQ
ncbi:hypothetical protein HK102_006123, partial [Quaeritorhiza haematococci]